MSKKRMIDTRFWEDVWVVDRLNPLDRYLMLYFLTNSKTNVAGVYEISLKTIANETGIAADEVVSMVRRLEPRVRYMDGWVILQNAIKHQNYKNESIKKGIEFCLNQCPPELLNYVICPNDWIPAVVKNSTGNLQMGLDDSPPSGVPGLGNLNINKNKNINKKPQTTSPIGPGLSGQKSFNKNSPGYKKFLEQKNKFKNKGV